MHRINLTTAWSCFRTAEGREGWTRWFGCPTNVTPPDQVWLVAEPQVQARLWLNGQPLVEAAPGAAGVVVTARLCPRNLLVVPPADTEAAETKAWVEAQQAGSLATTRATLPSAWGVIALVIAEDVVDSEAVTNR